MLGKKQLCVLVGMTALGLMAGSANAALTAGEAINVDLGASGSPVYSGQGVVASPGNVWNGVSFAGATWVGVFSTPLVDSSGTPTGVTLEIGTDPATVMEWRNWAPWSGPMGDVFGDEVINWGVDSVIIHGLDNALTYDLILYNATWAPGTTTFTVNGDSKVSTVVDSSVAPYLEGEQFVTFSGVPTDGAGAITYIMSGNPGAHGGLQIVAVPEPATLGLAATGLLLMLNRRR
jgi:PEP-CTERM motif